MRKQDARDVMGREVVLIESRRPLTQAEVEQRAAAYVYRRRKARRGGWLSSLWNWLR